MPHERRLTANELKVARRALLSQHPDFRYTLVTNNAEMADAWADLFPGVTILLGGKHYAGPFPGTSNGVAPVAEDGTGAGHGGEPADGDAPLAD